MIKLEMKNKKYSGFSLVEMLITIFITLVIMSSVMVVFSKVIAARKTGKEIQTNLENARAAMESMAKEIRMSEVKYSDGTSLIIYDNSNVAHHCIKYSLLGDNRIAFMFSDYDNNDDGTNDCGAPGNRENISFRPDWKSLASNVSLLQFNSPTMTTVNSIGRVTILMQVDNVYLQTTTSLRNYDTIQPR